MKTNPMLRLLLMAITLASLGQSCVEPYELDYTLTKRIIIVDGLLSDNPLSANTITLKEAVPTGGSSFFLPIKEATVEVVVNNNDRYKFKELSDGIYQQPSELKVSDVNSYRLEFKTKQGATYKSSEEVFKASTPITKLYTNLELEGFKRPVGGYEPAHYLYLDTQDKPGKGNNYVWSWTLFEKQIVCESCINGRYFFSSRLGDGCRDESVPNQTEVFYNDYACSSPCWEVFKNTEINALTDTYLDGQPIIGRLIAKVPIYQYNGALIEVKQQSVSAGAFRYLKLLTEQSQNNGGLADTPPAALLGNIQNINQPDEAVGGYFMVVSESTRLFWIDRSEVIPQNLPVKGLLGRPVSFEVSLSDTSRPPLVSCKNTSTRTNLKPRGWVN